MIRFWALLATALVVLLLAGTTVEASTPSTETLTSTEASASAAAEPVDLGPSKQQQSAWLGSMLLSFLAMIGSVCLVSAWAAWAYHRSIATSIRCGAAVRQPVRIPAPVRVTVPARAAARRAVRPKAQLPQPVDVSLDELFSLTADRRPAPRTLGGRVLAFGRRLETPFAEAAARVGGRLAEAIRHGVATGRRDLRWNGGQFVDAGSSGARRVMRWNGLAFVGVPEEAHRDSRAVATGDGLQMAS